MSRAAKLLCCWMASKTLTIWVRSYAPPMPPGRLLSSCRSAVPPGLTETVAKSAAGALEYVPIVRVGNVSRAMEELKKRGYWIYGLDERGVQDYDKVEFNTPTVLVLGGEGQGLHQLVRDNCDVLVRIPMAGTIPSLNVSVAAGIVLFEWKRRMA